jgi:integrase
VPHERRWAATGGHATQLLQMEVHPIVVSERLGHASMGVTLDTCSHVMPGMLEEAVEKTYAGLRLRWRVSPARRRS